MRPVLLPALIALLALLAGACGDAVGNPGVAASVNDTDIAVAELREAYLAFLGSPGYENAVAQEGEAQVDRDAAGVFLGQLIVRQLLEQAAQARGLPEPTAEEITEVLESGGGDPDDEEARNQTRIQLLADRLQQDILAEVEVGEAEIQQTYQQLYAPEVSHILVETEEQAEQAINRLEEGETFAEVAAEVSIDPGSAQAGGALGQLVPGRFVPEFEEAALALDPGEVSEPVQTQFGWHVITAEAPPPLEEVEEEVIQTAQEQRGQQVLQEFFNELLLESEIVVNPRFGRWDSLQAIVVFADPLGELEPVEGAAESALPENVPLPAPTADQG